MKSFLVNYIPFIPEFHGVKNDAKSYDMPQRHFNPGGDGYYHSTMVAHHGKLYIFGGINRYRTPKRELVELDQNWKLSLEKIPGWYGGTDRRTKIFLVRSASSLKWKNYIFFFGGLSQYDSTLNRQRAFQVIRYNPSTRVYRTKILAGKNNIVKLRYGHTTALYKNKAYLFGGDFDVVDHNLYSFDCAKPRIFKKVEVSDRNKILPMPVFGHGSAVIGDFLFIFFGSKDNFGKSTKKVFKFHLRKRIWSEVVAINHEFVKGRFGFGLAKSEKNQFVYIFGGSEGANHLTNELLEYDHTMNVFRSIRITGKIPCPRFGHAVALNEKNELFVFGGVTGRNRSDYQTKFSKVKLFRENYIEPYRKMRKCARFIDIVVVCTDDIR